ncbi:MAG: hypothetical protein U5K31_10470 [Balneolaceae bacterium]|nr:hypothetical protein [Balneolaceae bacterium]
MTESRDQMLLGLIDNSLGSLAANDRCMRRTGGHILLGLGIGSAVGGAATLAFGEGDDAKIVGWSLIGGGALLGGVSLIPLKVKSETERLYLEFEEMPSETPEQIRRKYLYWDNRFAELAEKRRMERIIGGVTTIITAGATTLAIKELGEERLHTFVWPTLAGVTTLLVKTDAERRFDTYRSAKEELLRDGVRAEVRLGVAPLPTGGFMGSLRVSLR